MVEAPPRRSPLRYAVIGAVTTLLLVGLVWGGYVGYRNFAPYYGIGYTTGRSAAVQGVTFKVTSARCGLDAVPASSTKPVKGQFCVVDALATNNSATTRYLSLSMFSVQLDSGSRANPTSSAMRALSSKLRAGEDQDLQFVYDVWDGVRMESVKVQIGYETAQIPLL